MVPVKMKSVRQETKMKMLQRLFILGLPCCVLLALVANPVRAEIGFGRFTLLPELAIQEIYRSNIFQTEFDRKSDLITVVTPGIGLRYRFGENSLSLGYKVGFLNYARNSNNNYQDHRANGRLEFLLPAGFQFTLADDFVRSTLERSAQIDRQRPFHQNFLNAAASYGFADRWKAETKYQREDLAFDSSMDRFQEYTNSLVGASLYYRFLPRTSGLVEYDYVVKNFSGGDVADHKDHLIYAGVAFNPKGKLRGSLRAGYGWKKFDRNLAGRDNGPRTWIMATRIVGDFNPRTNLTFDAARGFADDTDFDNVSYVNTSTGLSLQHYFTSKIGSEAAISYRRSDYLDFTVEPVTGLLSKRNDKVWTFGASGFYNFQKWLQARIEYQYITRNSNFPTFSFDEHRAIFRVVFSL
jgi:polysaccharide biosynthesis protein VpsM